MRRPRAIRPRVAQNIGYDTLARVALINMTFISHFTTHVTLQGSHKCAYAILDHGRREGRKSEPPLSANIVSIISERDNIHLDVAAVYVAVIPKNPAARLPRRSIFDRALQQVPPGWRFPIGRCKGRLPRARTKRAWRASGRRAPRNRASILGTGSRSRGALKANCWPTSFSQYSHTDPPSGAIRW